MPMAMDDRPAVAAFFPFEPHGRPTWPQADAHGPDARAAPRRAGKRAVMPTRIAAVSASATPSRSSPSCAVPPSTMPSPRGTAWNGCGAVSSRNARTPAPDSTSAT